MYVCMYDYHIAVAIKPLAPFKTVEYVLMVLMY